MTDSDQLRKQLREQRRGLNESAQSSSAEKMLEIASSLEQFQHAERIAFYLANDGEIDPAALFSRAFTLGKQCYLPAVDLNRKNHLLFCPHQPDDPLHLNRYGISEPMRLTESVPVSELDLIFLPLVGFDRQGNRLGMGAGYYDRSLAECEPENKPLLIGLGHSFQELEALKANEWDVPLDGIVTEKEFIQSRGNK